MKFFLRPIVVPVFLCALASPSLSAQAKDFQLASCSRGDWASYSVSYEYADTPQLNSAGKEIIRFVSDTGPDSVELRGKSSIAGAEMRSGDVLNKNKPFEPIMGIGGAKVVVEKQSAEKITIKGKSYDCVKKVRRIERPLALERGVIGMKGTSTVWTSPQVPLGLVKMVNNLENVYSADYSQRCVETWVYKDGGYKTWTEDVETGAESETVVFGRDNAGTSLTADVLTQTADYIDTATAKMDALAPLIQALRTDDVAALRKLEAEGLDPVEFVFGGQLDGSGNMFIDAMNGAALFSQETTPLMEAAREGSLRVVKYLVETKKAPVNRRARTPPVGGTRLSDADPTIGRTALFFAATDDLSSATPERRAKKIAVARYLLARGADPNLPYRDDLGGQTWGNLLAWSVSCETENSRWGGMAAALLSGGADPNGKMWATLGEIGDDPLVTDTALMAAAEAGIMEDVKAIVEAGAKVNAETGDGRNAHFVAAMHAGESKERAAILRYLESKGAKPGQAEKMQN